MSTIFRPKFVDSEYFNPKTLKLSSNAPKSMKLEYREFMKATKQAQKLTEQLNKKKEGR
jgi:hypothetical protein